MLDFENVFGVVLSIFFLGNVLQLFGQFSTIVLPIHIECFFRQFLMIYMKILENKIGKMFMGYASWGLRSELQFSNFAKAFFSSKTNILWKILLKICAKYLVYIMFLCNFRFQNT